MTRASDERRGDRSSDLLARSVDPIALGCAVATGLVLAFAGALASSGLRVPHVVVAIALAFLPYAVLVRRPISPHPPRAMAIAITVAAASGLALVVAPPLLSDDVYRYLWDARVLRHGIDPYAYAPDDPALWPLRDAVHARVNHPDLPTIYPPLAQISFVLADLVAHAPWSAKLLALVAHLATTPVVARLAPAQAATHAPLFALNPLLVEEAALGGHVDALAGLWIAIAAYALGRRAPIAGALAIGAAAATKLVGVALVPLLLSSRVAARSTRERRRGVALGLALGLAAIAIAPIGSAGHARGRTSGLGAYARTWRGNDGGFALLAEGSRLALDLGGRVGGAPWGWIRLPFLAPIVQALDRTPLDLHPRGPKKEVQRPTSFSTRRLGDLAARALALAIVLTVAIGHARRGTRALHAARDVMLALLLVSPQVHPWYLVWLLPLEIAAGGVAGLAWSAVVLVAYAPLEGWIVARSWHETVMARAVEYSIVVTALGVERRRARGSSRTPVRAFVSA